jgi:hypothetical protein
MKIKECATGTIRTVRAGMRAARVIRPTQRPFTMTPDAIDVATRGDGRVEVLTPGDLTPGTLVYLLDPGSLGQNTARTWTCWANVVLGGESEGA